ncbi:HNH endonuclease [Aquitalea sp. S1-19]|nr:HNH endonuclease [Aquitalea sp. S1-19]
MFTGSSGEQYGYADDFDEKTECPSYTGEGQVGDMQMKSGNLAIATHASTGRALHVFETLGKGKPCRYLGEYVYASHEVKRGPDKNGDERNVIVFLLMAVAGKRLETQEEEAVLNSDIALFAGASLADLRHAAIAACQPQETTKPPQESVRIAYQRSARVKRYVLARSEGVCELCDNPAPFVRKSDGTPYLEPHHINRLSDGGLDHPQFVGAICPSCHREIHFGVSGQALNELLRAKVHEREAKMI